jgi:hypothetical protein
MQLFAFLCAFRRGGLKEVALTSFTMETIIWNEKSHQRAETNVVAKRVASTTQLE